jgi:hypothetical protein
MGYASRSGRARTSSRNPQAFGVCDRCAIWYNHSSLRWQYDWAGASLINKRILVCNTCYDEPQDQLRAIIIPADPMPIMNPRVEAYAWDEIDRRQLSGYNFTDPATGLPVVTGDTRVTTVPGDSIATTGASGNGITATITFSGTTVYAIGSAVTISGMSPAGYNGTYTITGSAAGSISYLNATTGSQTVSGTILIDVATNDTRVTQQTGAAPYSTNQLPGTDPNAVTYRNILSATNNGTGLIRLILTTTNGMKTNQRVIVRDIIGTLEANGTWVITVVDLTQIDLQNSVFVNSYVAGGYVINDPSLPYGFDEIPKTGPL